MTSEQKDGSYTATELFDLKRCTPSITRSQDGDKVTHICYKVNLDIIGTTITGLYTGMTKDKHPTDESVRNTAVLTWLLLTRDTHAVAFYNSISDTLDMRIELVFPTCTVKLLDAIFILLRSKGTQFNKIMWSLLSAILNSKQVDRNAIDSIGMRYASRTINAVEELAMISPENSMSFKQYAPKWYTEARSKRNWLCGCIYDSYYIPNRYEIRVLEERNDKMDNMNPRTDDVKPLLSNS